MYCPQCGATNEDEASTCSSCGFDLSKYRSQWQPGAEVQQTEQAPSGQVPAEQAAGVPAPAAPVPGAPTPVSSGGAPGTSGATGASQPQSYQPGPYQQAPSYQQAPASQAAPQYGQGQPYQQGPPYQQTPDQGGYQGPPYAPYGPQGAYGQVPHIPSYLGWAIAVLIVCFWPTGIPAVVYASRVDNKLIMGDIAGAQHSSHMAKVWCWITFGIWLAGIVIAIIAVILVLAVAGTTSVQGVIS